MDQQRKEEIDAIDTPVEISFPKQIQEQDTEYELKKKDSAVRGMIASGVTVIFAIAVLAPGLLVSTWTEAKEFLQLVLPPITGLLGSVLGFYFGTRKGN